MAVHVFSTFFFRVARDDIGSIYPLFGICCKQHHQRKQLISLQD